MDPQRFESKLQPLESKIQTLIIAYLRIREWIVRPVGPSAASCGWPDLYAAHLRYGYRWIECKRPEGYKFTPAQLEWFPKLHANGIGIWILTTNSDDEMNKLFKPANWWHYLNAFKCGT